MSKIAAFPLLLALAALAAALFGALHNQLSFTVGPDYFFYIKFPQFGVDGLPARLGAALVGVQASWWMGVIVGLPAFLFGLFAVPHPGRYLTVGLAAITLVILVATFAAFLGLAAGFMLMDHPFLAEVPVPDGAERSDILRAGLMHDASYAGGLLGAALAFWPMRAAMREG